MQTFLPYPSFIASLQCLDDKRLGCQRKEGKQVLKAIERDKWYKKYPIRLLCWIRGKKYKNPWFKHPAVQMWVGYEKALKLYLTIAIIEWEFRGKKNNMALPFKFIIRSKIAETLVNFADYPLWFGDRDFHDSHKSNLLRKDKKFYSQYNWDVKDNLGYVWPSKEGNKYGKNKC